ncbi:MAG: hypothetical protein U0821_14370 [Chloroflexota bacterium]
MSERPRGEASDGERQRLERQTDRNLRGLEHEQAGEIDAAIALYEANVADGFEGDWPYGRLVAAYEKLGRLDQAERVLLRAIDVFTSSERRTAQDRKSTLRAFKGRLRLVQRAAKQAAKPPPARRRIAPG